MLAQALYHSAQCRAAWRHVPGRELEGGLDAVAVPVCLVASRGRGSDVGRGNRPEGRTPGNEAPRLMGSAGLSGRLWTTEAKKGVGTESEWITSQGGRRSDANGLCIDAGLIDGWMDGKLHASPADSAWA